MRQALSNDRQVLEDLVDGLLEVVEGRRGSLVARAEAAARAVTATVLAAAVLTAAFAAFATLATPALTAVIAATLAAQLDEERGSNARFYASKKAGK